MNVKPLTPTEARRARNRAGTARSVLRAQHNRPAECIIIRSRGRLCLPCTPRGRSGNRYVTETVTRSVRGAARSTAAASSALLIQSWARMERISASQRAIPRRRPGDVSPAAFVPAMRPAMDAASSCAHIAPEREAGPIDGRCTNPAAGIRERPFEETLTRNEWRAEHGGFRTGACMAAIRPDGSWMRIRRRTGTTGVGFPHHPRILPPLSA
jgi:hypothetical protein